MKTLVKVIILLVITSLTSCAQQKKTSINEPVIEKVEFAEGPMCITGMWHTSDGIKVTSGNITEYFFIDIEVPPSIQRDRAEVQVIHRLVSSDSLVYESKLSSIIDTSLHVAYCLNTLGVFCSNNEYGAYFFTSLESPVGGLDPRVLIMWVYYKERIYRFEGVVPLHQDWSWDETYSFIPEKELKVVSEEAYNEAVALWEQHIHKYKEYYDKN